MRFSQHRILASVVQDSFDGRLKGRRCGLNVSDVPTRISQRNQSRSVICCSSGDGSESKSALHASLESKKDQSYYYAHQPRGGDEAPAPPPVHQALRTEKAIVEPTVKSISRYQFLDGDKIAKVYIPLDSVGQIDDTDIQSEFTSQSFSVTIHNYEPPNAVLRLNIPQLDGEVDPESCRVKKLEHKLVIYLTKLPDEDGKCFPWRHLKK